MRQQPASYSLSLNVALGRCFAVVRRRIVLVGVLFLGRHAFLEKRFARREGFGCFLFSSVRSCDVFAAGLALCSSSSVRATFTVTVGTTSP